MCAHLSSNDVAAATTLTLLSFLASVVQGSTSLGDGVFLQITWGILQQLVPYVTTESSLGADGLRVITMFMYVRLVIVPPFLLYRLWAGQQKRKEAAAAGATQSDGSSAVHQRSIGRQQAVKSVSFSLPPSPTIADDEAAVEASPDAVTVTSTTSTTSAPSAATAPLPSLLCVAPSVNATTTTIVVPIEHASGLKAEPEMFSARLFRLLAIPYTAWCMLGVLILQNAKSSEIRMYLGSVCIIFSFVYMGLKMWKVSPARKSMPSWLQRLLSPPFYVAGTRNQITVSAQVAAFLAFNLAGLMTTLAGIGSPPIMIAILLFDMPSHVTRFTFPVATMIGAYIRLFYSFYSGMISMEMWPFYLPAIISGVVGITVGVRIGNILSPGMYGASIFWLLILAGVVMLSSNPMITVPSLVLGLGGLLFKQLWWDPHFYPSTIPSKDKQHNSVASPQEGSDNPSLSSSSPPPSSSSSSTLAMAVETPSVLSIDMSQALKSDDIAAGSPSCVDASHQERCSQEDVNRKITICQDERINFLK